MTVKTAGSGACAGVMRAADASCVARPRSTMIGGASVAVRAYEACGGKAASLRVSMARSRARTAWRLPRMTVICGLSVVTGAAWGAVCGGGNAASFPGAAACGAGAGGVSLGLGDERNRRGCALGGSAAGGGAAAMGGGSATGGAIGAG
ncbi:MAG: hypothetical protein E6G97_13265 [Alphaproteobacteria bacterium]|nr:MAG: hypothetical protein E6G97_13265 [Alphaproteobacteria bacterium]